MKKVFALLMALVLVISAVPLMASASEEEGACSGNRTYSYIGSGQHISYCSCGNKEHTKTETCTLGTDSKCFRCGAVAPTQGELPAEKPKPQPEPTHNCEEHKVLVTNPDRITHKYICTECQATLSADENCDFGTTDICFVCGNKNPDAAPAIDFNCHCTESNIEGSYYESNGNGTHDILCKHDNIIIGEQKCDFGTTGECFYCGFKDIEEQKPSTEGCLCDKDLVASYESNGNGTHTTKCVHGKILSTTAPCHIVDGKCQYCDYEPHVCDFEAGVVSDYKGSHQMKCSCGKMSDPIKCYDADGDRKCDACGYVIYACQHEYELSKTMSKPTCTQDGLGMYTCKNCGHEMGGSIPATGHGDTEAVQHEKTHDVKCKDCGSLLTQGEHHYDDDRDGYCDVCAYKMSRPGTTTSDPALDNVPRTADLLAPVTILSGLMSTVGLVIKKRYF